jgi:hypothetical protein
LVAGFGRAEDIFDFTSVSKVWSISQTTQNFEGNFSSSVRGAKVLLLEFLVQNFRKLRVSEVFKVEWIINGESPR